MTREKIRLQRVHSENQRHLIMFRLTVHTQTTGSSYHIFLKVNVSVLTERWGGEKGIFTASWKEQIGWNFLGHEICVLSCPLLPKETISMPLPCTRRCLFAAVSVHFKKPKPNQQNLRLPRLLQPGRVAEDDLWPPLHSPGIQMWGATPRPWCLLEQQNPRNGLSVWQKKASVSYGSYHLVRCYLDNKNSCYKDNYLVI